MDEVLVRLSMCALGDGEGLAMRLGLEGGRTHIGHPDLDRVQALAAQPLAIARTLLRDGLSRSDDAMAPPVRLYVT